MRKIIHVDADCFFASVELTKHVSYKELPVAVGGSPRQRGVISTCNYVARAYGVRSAMSSAYAQRLCPDLHFFSPNMSLYKEVSDQIMDILQRYTSKFERVSIDEAYLDVTGSPLFRGSATLMAQDIQKKIKHELGLDVSAGVAGNKLLAKIASDWRKPCGIYTISPAMVDQFVSQLPLTRLPGVGPQTLKKLNLLGLYSCQDVQNSDLSILSKHFGVFASRLLDMSTGVDDRDVKEVRDSKSVSIEHTFSEDIGSARLLVAEIPVLLEKLNTRYSRIASEVRPAKRTLKIKFADFNHTSVEAGLSGYGDVLDIQQYERLAFIARQRRDLPVRLLGLGLRFSRLEALKQLELPLF